MTSPGFRWDRSSRAVLGDALARLGPSRCVAEVRPEEVVLAEVPGACRARPLLGCGAMLSTVWTVLRVLGREPVVRFPADPDHPDVAAVVRAGAARTTASSEWARYAALRKLAEPPGPLRPVSTAVLTAVAGDDFWPDTAVRPEQALERFGLDPRGQTPLLVTTPGDSRRERVLAGAALHATRLAAAVRGCSSRIVALPAEGRYLEEPLLPGVPQVLLLVGLATPKRRKTG